MPPPEVDTRGPLAQRGLMIAVIALFVLAGGLGVAFVLSNRTDPLDASNKGGGKPAVQTDQSEAPFDSVSDEPVVQQTTRRPTSSRPQKTNKPSASVSASISSAPPSVTPTSKPTTEPTKPTTEPTKPTTEPTDPTTPPDGTTNEG
jgi:serine/threonine-protein kinase